MDDPIQATALSLTAISQRYEATAHNLANASTIGYKRCGAATMAAEVPVEGAPTGSVATVPGTTVALATRTFIDFTQGALIQTGRPLDVALHGPGFLVLETPGGDRYTRNGVLRPNAAGQLVDSEGRTVAGEGGPIVLPSTASGMAISIGTDGRIMAGGKNIGQLRVVEFADPVALVPVGQNAFEAPAAAAPAPATKTTVEQGAQEASNVRVVDELVNLITCTRLYEATLKNVTVQDERMKSLLQVAMA
jgi:flagellar basal body rod protein FlgG